MKLYLSILLSVLVSCDQNKSVPVAEVIKEKDEIKRKTETFESFSKRFSTDSVFQRTHLEDTMLLADTAFRSTQTLYNKLAESIFSTAGSSKDTLFIGYSLTIGADGILERIYNDGGKGSSERLFKHEPGGWVLVRYDNLNWYIYHPYGKPIR